MSTYVLLSHGKLGQAALNLIQSIEDHRDKCIPSRFANPPGKIRFSLDPNIRLEMQNEAITVEELGPALDREARRVMQRRDHETGKINSGKHCRRYAGLKSKPPMVFEHCPR